MSRQLEAYGHEVIVANPRNVRLIGESTRKDDRLDARTLARLARIDPNLLSPVRHRGAEAQAHLAVIRDASEAGRQLELHYYSASSDRESTRVVDPDSVRLIEGHWYLDGYCHNVAGMRRFRVDRVSAARLTGEAAEHRGEDAEAQHPDGTPPSSEAFVPGPEATVAHLAVDDEAVWITEALLNSTSAPLPDGRTGVTLAVASTVWFGRLLLRLGPHAEVLDPPELAETGRHAARQLLARYRENAAS